MQTFQTKIIDNRYELGEILGSGGMGTVYKAVDLLTGKSVALKYLQKNSKELMFGTTSNIADFDLALAREFRTLASLRHPNIISVNDYGFDAQKTPYYTMELIDNSRNIVKASQYLDVTDKIDLVIQMLHALEYLHWRGVLHRDLKPDNVLVNEYGTVKVMDFGLAVETASTSMRHATDSFSGTLAYSAPEQLSDQIVSRGSDLWAVGVMIYEMLTGQHPFYKDNFTALIQAILSTPIDESMLLRVNPAIRAIVVRLLEKVPSQRYERAQEVLRDLYIATGQTAPPETRSTRESYLRAARFVGRESEFELLRDGLNQAKEGRGSAFLVGGESGVGKSRLIEEVRINALVDGFLVLRGQATTEHTPYELWREAFQRLILHTPLTDGEAVLLKGIVPDLERLLGRVVSGNAAQDDMAQARLNSLTVGMFANQPRPVLLILEDLQWAEDNVGMINHLVQAVSELPLVILGSYRTDEDTTIASRLSTMQNILLRRLASDEIARLSSAILGNSQENEHVIEYLEHETDGNVFFLLEVLHTLADRAGRLDMIGGTTLPTKLVSKGVRAVLEHRVEQLSIQERSYLEFAAVMGRAIDTTILTATFPELNLDKWLLRCSNVNIIEIQSNVWRFSHDKLREFLIDELTPIQLRQMYLRIATSIETVYADSPQHAVLLATYLEKAIDLEQPDLPLMEKTIRALARAADITEASFAFHAAMDLYNRLLKLEQQHRDLHLLHNRPPIDNADVAHWLSKKAVLAGFNWLVDDSLYSYEKALNLLGNPMPQTTRGVAGQVMSQLGRQILHRMFPSRFIGRADETERNRLKKVAEIYEKSGQTYYFAHKQMQSLYISLRALNMQEHLGASRSLMQSYAQMCLLTGTIGSRRLADFYYKQIQKLANQELSANEFAFMTSVYYIGQGDFERVQHDVAESARLYKQRGAPWEAGYSRLLYAASLTQQGKFDLAYTMFTEIEQAGREAHITQLQIFSTYYLAHINMMRGRQEEAVQLAEKCLGMVAQLEHTDLLSLDPLSYSARIYLFSGRFANAYKSAETAMEVGRRANITGQWGKNAYPALIEVYLGLRGRRALAGVSDDDLLEKARGALKQLSRLPDRLGATNLAYSKGLIAFASGKPAEAYKAWYKALKMAEEIALPVQQGQTHLALGRYLPAADPKQAEHLKQAEEIFTRLNLNSYLAQLKQIDIHVQSQ